MSAPERLVGVEFAGFDTAAHLGRGRDAMEPRPLILS